MIEVGVHLRGKAQAAFRSAWPECGKFLISTFDFVASYRSLDVGDCL
jgi:hypothetical protein